MKFKKAISIALLSGAIFLIKPSQVQAITVVAASSTVVGDTEVIALTASPSGTYNTATIDLSFSSEFVILDYEAPAGSWTLTNTCTGGVAFTDTTLCIDLQKNTGDIVNGDDLGLITVSIVGAGDLTVTGTSNNGYTDGGVGVETVSGTLLTMSATGESTPTTLPDTAIGDTLVLGYTSAVGLLLMSFGTGYMLLRLTQQEYAYIKKNNYEKALIK